MLQRLPQAEWDTMRPFMGRVRLVTGQSLTEADQFNEYVFFLEEGLASVLIEGELGSKRVQVAMIGREGMVGSLPSLGCATPPTATTVMQVAGMALRMTATALKQLLDTCPELRRECIDFSGRMMCQAMLTAADYARSALVDRCIRWLLMAHERIEGDEILVTHEMLSELLGVRRSGVTTTFIKLQESGLIDNRRGRVRVLDRTGLQRMLAGYGAAASRSRFSTDGVAAGFAAS